MVELKSRNPEAKAKKERQYKALYVSREVYSELRDFVNNEHPLQPTLKSATEVALQEWFDRERQAIAEGDYDSALES